MSGVSGDSDTLRLSDLGADQQRLLLRLLLDDSNVDAVLQAQQRVSQTAPKNKWRIMVKALMKAKGCGRKEATVSGKWLNDCKERCRQKVALWLAVLRRTETVVPVLRSEKDEYKLLHDDNKETKMHCQEERSNGEEEGERKESADSGEGDSSPVSKKRKFDSDAETDEEAKQASSPDSSPTPPQSPLPVALPSTTLPVHAAGGAASSAAAVHPLSPPLHSSLPVAQSSHGAADTVPVESRSSSSNGLLASCPQPPLASGLQMLFGRQASRAGGAS